MPKKLKVWNGGDWGHRGGHIFICAYSWQDAVDLANEACKKVQGHGGSFTLGYARTYWHAGCWGNSMDGVTPERGVWHAPPIAGGWYGKPVRVI
jgi:hypothetical protein